MTPKEFLEVTEANLLTHLGEELHTFFSDRKTIYTAWDEAQKDAGCFKNLHQINESGMVSPLPIGLQKLLYFKREELNPASSVNPVAQCNMVANVTFHLMAQQIAIVLHEMKELNKDKVLDTSFTNIRKLVDRYTREIQEAKREEEFKNAKAHGEGSETRGPSPV